MPWNKPGDSSNKKDPWTGRPKQLPPDLEAFLRNLYKKIVTLFKLKSLNKNHLLSTKPFLSTRFNTKAIKFFSIAFLIIWLVCGFFIVNPAEQAITIRLGRYNATLTPGYHWILKPIEKYYIINTKKISQLPIQVTLLTLDKNKISIHIEADYHITNTRDYLFSTKNPLLDLEQGMINVINRALAPLTFAQISENPHHSLEEYLKKQLNNLMGIYHTGLTIDQINLKFIQTPEQLKTSFSVVTNAQIDKEELENQAKAYAAQVETNAKNQAQVLIDDAKSYRQETILNAKIETERFLALLPAYKAAPQLTCQRLYLKTLQKIMEYNNKLLIHNAGDTTLSFIVEKSSGDEPSNKMKLASLEPFKVGEANIHTKPLVNNVLPSSYDIGGYE